MPFLFRCYQYPYFENHKAKLEKGEKITILNWRNKNGGSFYYIRYVLDGNYLYITGDIGCAIFKFSEKADLETIAKYYDFDYFKSKDITFIVDDKIIRLYLVGIKMAVKQLFWHKEEFF